MVTPFSLCWEVKKGSSYVFTFTFIHFALNHFKIFHENGNQRETRVAILLSDKIEFKIKNVARDKKGHYIMIKGSIQEEDITILNIYAPNTGAPQHIRQLQTALKEESDSNTIIVGDFNTSLTPMDRSFKHNINKETQALNDTKMRTQRGLVWQ